MKKFGAVLLGIVLFFVLTQGAYATTTPALQRPVCTISASSYSVRLGGTVNLTWSSQYATAGTITSLGSVALYGSQGVIPTGEGTTYVGTFTGPGGTGTCSVRVSTILNDGGGGDIDTSGDVDTSGTIDTPGSVNSPGSVNAPGTLGAPPVQNAAPIMPGGSGGSSGGSVINKLVPCGGPNDPGGATGCQACKLASLGQNIINFLVGISIPLAAVMFAYAGFIYFTSSVIDKIEKAKKIFTSVLIGFAIVIGGYLIVETILHALLNESYWKSWNQIQCVPDGSRKTDATIADLLKNLSVTNSGGTTIGGGVGRTGTNGASGNDLDNRNILRDNGITVSSTGNCADQNSSNCTSLNGLQSSALSGAIDMGYNCGCSLNVSGGTETGHESGPYSHSSGYKLDFSFNERLDNYIQGWTNTGNRRGDNAPTYTSGNTVCAREGNHWDCQFR